MVPGGDTPLGGGDVLCAYQQGLGLRPVLSLRLLHAIGSARSHNVLRAELDLHAHTCVIG